MPREMFQDNTPRSAYILCIHYYFGLFNIMEKMVKVFMVVFKFTSRTDNYFLLCLHINIRRVFNYFRYYYIHIFFFFNESKL